MPGTTFSWTVIQNNVTGASDASGNTINQQLMATTFNPGTATYIVTPSFGGCPGAPIAVLVTVNPSIPTPPINFTGCATKNKFLTQTELINILTWSPSSDPTVISYRLYQNGVLVATIASNGPYEVTLHNRVPHVIYVYTLTAVNALGESLPVLFICPMIRAVEIEIKDFSINNAIMQTTPQGEHEG